LSVASNFGDLRDVSAPAEADGDAATCAFGKRLAPIGFLSRKLDDAAATPDVDLAAITKIDCAGRAESAEKKFDGVATGGVSKLVEKAGKDELIAGRIDGAPVAERHIGVGDRKLEAEVGSEGARKVEGIDLGCLLRRDAGSVVKDFDGGRGAAMEPGDEVVLVVEASLEEVVSGGAVEIVANVVFAGPDDLDRSFQLAREESGFHGVILNETAAETAADESDMDLDVVARNVEGGGDGISGSAWNLRRRPDFAGVGSDGGDAIYRLHRGVGKEGDFVGGFDALRRAGVSFGEVAVGVNDDRRLGSKLSHFLAE